MGGIHNGFYGFCTDASGGRIDDTLECAVIVTMGDETQVAQSIFNFCSLEKAQAAVDTIGDLFSD